MSTNPETAADHKPQELGWGSVCLGVADIKASLEFYSKLGFTVVGGNPEEKWVIICNAEAVLGLFEGMFSGHMLNFRGIHIQDLAAEMKNRGFELENFVEFVAGKYPPEWSQDADGNELPPGGAGSFTIMDPDGVAVFFDTVPAERAAFSSGQKYGEPSITGDLQENQQPLGWMTYCINTKDVRAAFDFYQRLGFSVSVDQLNDGWGCVENKTPHSFSVSLFQGHISTNLLNFRGGDVFAIGKRLAAAGLTIKLGPEKESDGSDGLWLDDPDGNSIYFNTSPGEEI